MPHLRVEQTYYLPYRHSATPEILDFATKKQLFSPVYLTTCSALSSDKLPIWVDTHNVDHSFSAHQIARI